MSKKILFVFWVQLIGRSLLGTSGELSVFSLNLHGYHPMGEKERYWEDKGGTLRLAPSDIYFFSWEEIQRGHLRRINKLSVDLVRLSPDLILFQEVGAGSPYSQKGCENFYSASGAYTNAAKKIHDQLTERGKRYQLHLACRGNVGWWTSDATFQNERIVKLENGMRKVVHDFNSNPYPKGILVEGFAVLASEKIRVLEHLNWSISVAARERFQVELLAFRERDNDLWYLVTNIHGGHKVRHFEQTVFLRRELEVYVNQAGFGRFGGFILAGDFNVSLFRPASKRGEVSSVGWEITVKSEFDYSIGGTGLQRLESELIELNGDILYKPWANILDPSIAVSRIRRAVLEFVGWQKSITGSNPSRKLNESIDRAKKDGTCKPYPNFDASCEREDRIDFIFGSPSLLLRNAFIIYPSHNWNLLSSLSDHPAVFTQWSITSGE